MISWQLEVNTHNTAWNCIGTFSILGTMKAACDLIDGLDNVEVAQVFVIMELEFLKGRTHLPSSVKFKSLLKYD